MAKRPRRQPWRNPNRATPVDDEITLHGRDLTKLKASTETSRIKLAIEDKPKPTVAPKMAQPVARKGNIKDAITKTQPKLQPKAQPEHDTYLDNNTLKSYWVSEPKGYIVDQLHKRRAEPTLVSTLMRKSKDMLSNSILGSYMSIA